MTSSQPTGTPTTTRSATPRFDRSTLLDQLDREWCHLRRSRRAMRQVARWLQQGDLVLDSHPRDLDGVVDALQPSSGSASAASQRLASLVQLASNEPLAARIVLQRILPGVISQAARWRTTGSSQHPVDVAIGAAWMAIAGFDTERRTNNVAPALISDTLWIAFRRDTRRRSHSEVVTSTNLLGTHESPTTDLHPTVALAATIRAAAAAGVPDEDLEFIRSLARAGSPSAAARQRSVTPRTIRNHRDRAAARIRSALGEDWAADWRDPLITAA